jgi:hypothetical protein
MIKRFEQYINESVNLSEREIIDEANNILKRYKSSPMWNQVILYLNDADIDYTSWTDLDMLGYYLAVIEADANESVVVDEIHKNLGNYLGKVIDNATDKEIKDHGAMLGRQLNTAGGRHLMKDEITNFVYKHRDLVPELTGAIRVDKIDDVVE